MNEMDFIRQQFAMWGTTAYTLRDEGKELPSYAAVRSTEGTWVALGPKGEIGRFPDRNNAMKLVLKSYLEEGK